MQKNKTVLEIMINEKKFEFLCDANSTLGEVFDALTSMRGFIVTKINEHSEEKKES